MFFYARYNELIQNDRVLISLFRDPQSPIVSEQVFVPSTGVKGQGAKDTEVKVTDAKMTEVVPEISISEHAENSTTQSTDVNSIETIEVKVSVDTVKSVTDEDRSEADSVSLTMAEKMSKLSKSWADMVEEGSSVDMDELPEFEDSDMDKASTASDRDERKTGKKSQKERKKLNPEDRRKTRDSRKVEVVQHDDECFD